MRVLLMTVVLSVCCMGAWAAEAQDEVMVDMKSQVLSKFLDRAVLRNEDPVTRSDVRVEYKNFGLEIGGVADLTNFDDNAGELTDVDVQLDYTYHRKALAIQMGFGYFTYPNSTEDNTAEVFTKFSYDLKYGLTPYLKVAYDFDEADGYYSELGLNHTLNLLPETMNLWKIDRVELKSHANVSYGSSNYNDYYFGDNGNGFEMAKIGTGSEFGIGKKWTLTPEAEYYYTMDGHTDNLMDSRGNGFIYGLSLDCKF